MSDDEARRALNQLREERDLLKEAADRHYSSYLTTFKECERLKQENERLVKRGSAAEIELARIRDIAKTYLDIR